MAAPEGSFLIRSTSHSVEVEALNPPQTQNQPETTHKRESMSERTSAIMEVAMTCLDDIDDEPLDKEEKEKKEDEEKKEEEETKEEAKEEEKGSEIPKEMKYHCICGKILHGHNIKLREDSMTPHSRKTPTESDNFGLGGGMRNLFEFRNFDSIYYPDLKTDEDVEEALHQASLRIQQHSLRVDDDGKHQYTDSWNIDSPDTKSFEMEQQATQRLNTSNLKIEVKTLIKCYECQLKMNSKYPQYKCDEIEIAKSKDNHIAYCQTCYDLIKDFKPNIECFGYIKNEKNINEEEEQVFEISTRYTSDNELSRTETSHQSETSETPETSLKSPHTKPMIKSVKSAPTDYYKFKTKLKKMIIDHKDKQSHSTGSNVLYPVHKVFVSPHEDKNPDRLCFISVDVTHLSIKERYETGIAECKVKMVVKLYWMLSEGDYIKYNELQRRNKHQNLNVSRKEIKFKFVPEFDVYRAGKMDTEQQQIKLITFDSFFGPEILKNMYTICSKNLLFGYMAEVSYYSEVTIFEPFEIENFPFDCQDIPIVMEPKNFHTLAPAYLGKKDKTFVNIAHDATNLGRWSMKNTICEFNNKKAGNTLRIMLKLKRFSAPYLLENVVLIGAVSLLGLTAFSVDNIGEEVKHERLAIVLGLILTLIFISLPNVPRVTLLHGYYYASFVYLFLMSFHFASEAYYAPTLLKIEDAACYEYVYGDGIDVDETDCSMYQLNNYNFMAFILFVCLWVFYHMIIIVICFIVNIAENEKLNMGSKDIRKKVEKTYNTWEIATSSDIYGVEDADDYRKKKKYEQEGSRDIIHGKRLEETVAGEDEDAFDEEHNKLRIQRQKFNKSLSTMTDISIYVGILLSIIISFVLIPVITSALQYSFFQLDWCDVDDTYIDHHFAFLVISIVQATLCLLSTLYWFECCSVSSLVFYTSPITVLVILINYAFAIRSFVPHFYGTIQCSDDWDDLLFWLLFAWMVVYAVMFAIFSILIGFGSNLVEENGIQDTPDKDVVFLEFCRDSVQYFILPKYQYFIVKILTIVIPGIIQYSASVLLLLSIGSSDCKSNESSEYLAMALLIVSLFLLGVRIALQGRNTFFLYFTYFMCFYQCVNVLTIYGFVYIDVDCGYKHSNSLLANILWYLMLLWIIYDNISIIGVIIELGLNYYQIHFKTVPFLSLLTIGSAMILQLPACIVQLYYLLRYDPKGKVILSTKHTITLIAVIWLQILIYKTMSITKWKIDSNLSIIPVYICASIIVVLSIHSFCFWIFVDDISVTSVLLIILFGLGIVYDLTLLFCPTLIIPWAAFEFYGKHLKHKKNNMFRVMIGEFIIFLLLELPPCFIQLVFIWTGHLDAITSAEGVALVVLTWIALIIQFVYTFIYYDRDPNVREFASKAWPKFEKSYYPRLGLTKYTSYVIISCIWVILIHCFAYWSKEDLFGIVWWFFFVWILYYMIGSVTPSFGYLVLMFYSRDLKKLVNNIFILMFVVVFVFVELPASMVQLMVIEFSQCDDKIGHTLDDGVAESFCIITFNLLQLILFYTICDILGWNIKAKHVSEEMMKDTAKKRRDQEVEDYAKLKRKKYIYSLKENSSEWRRLRRMGFSTLKGFKLAVRKLQKELRIEKHRIEFKEKYGTYVLIAFFVVYFVQFGLAIHSFTYWNKSDDQIDCGSDSTLKRVLHVWFLIWIIMYGSILVIYPGLLVFKDNIEKTCTGCTKDTSDKSDKNNKNDKNDKSIANTVQKD